MHTFSYCEVMFCRKCGSQIGNKYHFCSTCGHKTRSELTDSVPLQLQDSICEKGTIWIYFQAGYRYEVVVVFLHLYTTTLTLVKKRSNVDLFVMILHMELAWYTFSPLLQYELEHVKRQWNTHYIKT